MSQLRPFLPTAGEARAIGREYGRAIAGTALHDRMRWLAETCPGLTQREAAAQLLRRHPRWRPPWRSWGISRDQGLKRLWARAFDKGARQMLRAIARRGCEVEL